MAFDTLEKAHFIIRILSLFCILTNKKLSNLLPKLEPIYYKLLLHGPLTFTATLLMWLQVAFSSDLNQAADALYVTLTETGLVVKILSVWYYDALIESLFNEWRQHAMLKLQRTQECNVWRGEMKVYGSLVFLYIGCSMTAVICASVSVLFLNRYQLPFPIWFPFNWQHPINFWYAYVYELVAIPLTSISNCALDMFFCYMMQHLALHFKVTAMRLEILGTKQNDTNAVTNKKLLAIIKLHLELKRMTRLCELVVMYPILSQISLSALVLCFSLYRLQNFNVLEDPIKFLSIALYAVVMNFQIFMFCFYGNKLTLESAALIRSLYNCNWPDMSMQNRKIVLQYMQSLQYPVVIKAGSFFNVDLATYTKTMNNAYSFFALLLNMDTE